MRLEIVMINDNTSYVQSPWLSYTSAAQYLGVAVGTLRNWVCARRVPFVRRGRVVRFRRESLDDWLQSGCASRSR